MSSPVALPIERQTAQEDQFISFQLLPGTFSDPDGDDLTLLATQGDGSPLPVWLSFDAATLTFSGQPPQDYHGNIEVSVTASDLEGSATSTFTLEILPVNDAPSLTLNAVYQDDFDGPDSVHWFNYIEGDDVQDPMALAEDAPGDNSLISVGPWWLDPNHEPPGTGFLHLLAVIYTNGGPNGTDGVIVQDMRELTIAFDIRADGLEIPEGANLYFWFQAADPQLQWGEGQLVNYAFIANPIQSQLVDGDWVRVTIDLTMNEADWLALGSSEERSGTYSISASIADALAGRPVDMGLIMLLDGENVGGASGEVRIDNILVEEGGIARRHIEARYLENPQRIGLDVSVGDVEDTTFDGYQLVLAAGPGVPAGLTASLTLDTLSNLSVEAGEILLDGVGIGTIGTGGAGELLELSILAPTNASVVEELIRSISLLHPSALPGEVYPLELRLIDPDGVETSLPIELYADEQPYDGSGDDLVTGTAASETLFGGAGNDRLEGGAGNDVLVGDSGHDVTVGGPGDDRHFVDQAGDVVEEIAGGGTADWILTSVSFVLADGIDIEFLSTDDNMATTAIDLAGNTLANTLLGNAGSNRLSGGGGNDHLDGRGGIDTTIGGSGDDLHFVDAMGDLVEEIAGGGTADRVLASVSYVLAAGADVEILSTVNNVATTAIDLTGNGLANTLYGNAGSNRLDGAAGNDILDGGAGADTTIGGVGDDWHFVDQAGDFVQEAVGEGIADRVFALASYALAAGVEVEILSTGDSLGTAPIDLTGNGFANVLFGNAGANRLAGGGGDDQLFGDAGNDITVGGTGDDLHFVDQAGDVVEEQVGEGSSDRVFASISYGLGAMAEVEILSTADNDGTAPIDLTGNGFANTLFGNAGANFLRGGGGADSLAGFAGDDRLDGGTGADSTNGGLGDDWHYVDQAGDIVGEAAGEGNADRVLASASYTLAAGVFVEILSTADNLAPAPIDLTGNELDNIVYGNAGANRLVGNAGNDQLVGMEGNDRLEGGTGADTLKGGIGDDTLLGATGADTLLGDSGSDQIDGGDGDDRLYGGAGVDHTTGGAGDDWHYVDHAGDIVTEAVGGGSADRVFASVSWTLAAGSEVEILSTDDSLALSAIDLTGNAIANTIYGNAGANRLRGGGGADQLLGLEGNDRLEGEAGNDLLQGSAGDDQLDGGAGADVAEGGAGDDYYYVDSLADVLVEAAGGGTADRLFASASYALAAGVDVEILSTIDTLATTAINLTGNELANIVYGNAGSNSLSGGGGNDQLVGFEGNDQLDGGAGADVLKGGTGADVLIGGAGNDVLSGDSGNDSLEGGTGDDWYYVDVAGDTVIEVSGGGTADRVVAAVSWVLTAGAQVEMITTVDNLATTAINLTGNELANTIFGNAGANVLDGKSGADTLVGLEGADTFAFTTALGGGNVDNISGFAAGLDKIALDDAVFIGLAPGALPAGAFRTGTMALDADDRIIYDPSSGAIYFDADGVGGTAAVHFATVNTGLALGAGDFVVI